MPPAAHTIWLVLLVLATSVWLGGYVALAVVARASATSLEPAARVAFFQGDACNLKPQFTGYDFILAANLVDRLYEPAKFLKSIHERLKVGGLMLVATPCTWLVEHTPRERWVGGFKKDGRPVRTLDGLAQALAPHFERVGAVHEVPFVIRETRRKHQHTLSQATFWRRVR